VKKESISVVVRDAPPKVVPPPPMPLTPPSAPHETPRPPKAPEPKAQPQQQVATPKPGPQVPPSAPAQPPGAVTPPDMRADNAPPGPVGGPRQDLGKMNLFDPNAVGLSMPRSRPGLPVADRLGGNGTDPNSHAAEKARVSARLGQQVQQAMSNAMIDAGFLASCDDGIDNNLDGEIDCADPGCRRLEICDYTGVYGDNKSDIIPDGEGGIVRWFDVEQEGKVRKLALKIDVSHASPGDLAIILIAPNGQRAELRTPDRSDGTFTRAYYVRPFIGMAASGRWTLRVEDRIHGTAGTFKGWSLFVTS
jgi:hypothetical protein